jgi:hypothetical protein
MNDTERSTHQAFFGAWILIAVLLFFGWGWLGFGGGFVFGGFGAALCLVPLVGHALAMKGQSAGGGIVALSCLAALVPAFLTLPVGWYYHFVGVYPFVGLVWIAFLLSNVATGLKTLKS